MMSVPTDTFIVRMINYDNELKYNDDLEVEFRQQHPQAQLIFQIRLDLNNIRSAGNRLIKKLKQRQQQQQQQQQQ